MTIKLDQWRQLVLGETALEAYQEISAAAQLAENGALALGVHGDAASLVLMWPHRRAQLRLLHARAGEVVGYLNEADEADEPEEGVTPPPDEVEAMELALNVTPGFRRDFERALDSRGLRLMLAFDGRRATLAANDKPTLDGAVSLATYRAGRAGRWPRTVGDIDLLPSHFGRALQAKAARLAQEAR